MFTLAAGAFLFYFKFAYSDRHAWYFLLALVPVLAYFFYWFAQALRNQAKADYGHTMLLNYISAIALNGFFVFLYLDTARV